MLSKTSDGVAAYLSGRLRMFSRRRRKPESVPAACCARRSTLVPGGRQVDARWAPCWCQVGTRLMPGGRHVGAPGGQASLRSARQSRVGECVDTKGNDVDTKGNDVNTKGNDVDTKGNDASGMRQNPQKNLRSPPHPLKTFR
eukprot:1194429-Prorocentrum_minimum.AAC.3